ncbi:S53 family peptidase [Microbacterium deminutum]|uniref:S53 family peptidase n=1 Tax=Microbacterium deminutum TaxID=344164 RepID=UPI0031E3500C
MLRRRAPLDPETIGRVEPGELDRRFGAEPTALENVVSVMRGLGFTVLEADGASRRVRIRGTVADAERAFGVELTRVRSASPAGPVVEHWYRTGGLSIPAELDGVVTAVLGLDNRPQARPQFRTVPAQAVSVSYTPLQLGEIYDFPMGTDGTGQTIGIVELGGGFAQSDLTAYFSSLGLDASPRVTAVSVDNAKNVPYGDPNGADGEVLLDIEVIGTLAPKADILVYFAPNTDAGFLDAVAHAAHATPTPTAISVSWGQSEDQWTAQARSALDEALTDAAALGVTVTVAAGDDGSTDREKSGTHVDFPASSPSALACGGTTLEAVGTTVSSETVWNNGSQGGATGGGVSDAFPLPTWQKTAGVPVAPSGGGRGVPDVAGDADPQTGYLVRIDGKTSVIGGTSAVAPLWAALIARLAQALGAPLGLAQPRLYAAATGFRDITVGNNGAYQAGRGWDPCTGLGVPRGQALLSALSSTTASEAADNQAG